MRTVRNGSSGLKSANKLILTRFLTGDFPKPNADRSTPPAIVVLIKVLLDRSMTEILS